MTRTSPSFTLSTPSQARVRAYVVASEADIESLRADKALPNLGDIELHSQAPDAPVPDAVLADASVLVLEIDSANPVSIGRIAEIRRNFPGVAIIAALRTAAVPAVRALMQHGIADIVQLPFDMKELAARIEDAAARFRKGSTASRLAPMFTIAGAAGGCGATTVITHLAAALAGLDGGRHRVCVVDLDMQGGEVADYVGQEARVTISALLDAGDRLDAAMLRGALTDSRHGFSLIAAPTGITPLEQVNVDHLLNLLSLVRREFDFVLVDLPTDWTSWGLSVATASTRLFLVVETSVASMRQAKRRLELFDSVGIARGKVELLVNRVEHKLFRSIGLDEVREVLGKDIRAELGDEEQAMQSAQNEGLLIGDVHSHARFIKDINKLAQTLLAQQVETP